MKQTHTPVVLVVSLLLTLAFMPSAVPAEDTLKTKPKLYDEQADGFKQVADAVAIAKKDGKRVLLDFGYNRCGWCLRLHALFETDKAVSEILKADYVVVYIDWAGGVPRKGGHNMEVDAKYQARTLYRAPSLVVLDSDSTRLTAKDTAELEEGDHHSPQKVLEFLKQWAPKR
jgi:thioredoxin-related protein